MYADFVLNKGIEESFNAFRRGFMKMVVTSPLYKWYTPDELEILLCGSNVRLKTVYYVVFLELNFFNVQLIKVFDWESLESSTTYDSGFEPDHTYIKLFLHF